MVKIVFGTDGWRGIAGKELGNVRGVAQAVANYLIDHSLQNKCGRILMNREQLYKNESALRQRCS